MIPEDNIILLRCIHVPLYLMLNLYPRRNEN